MRRPSMVILGCLAAAYLALCPTQCAAQESKPKTLPAKLKIHSVEVLTGKHSSFRSNLDITAVIEVPNLDYRSPLLQKNNISFGYQHDTGVKDWAKSLVSLKGHCDSAATGPKGGGPSGGGDIDPDNGNFHVTVQGNRITVGANAGPFDMGDGFGYVDSPPFPMDPDTGRDAFWTVESSWNGHGWGGTAKHHKKEKEGESNETVTFSFDLQPPKTELKYGKTDMDTADLMWQGGKEIDRIVYYQGENSWQVHANFAGQFSINGESQVHFNEVEKAPTIRCSEADAGQVANRVKSDYQIVRWSQSWLIDDKGRLAKRPIDPWHLDVRCPIQDWLDHPGFGGGTGPPNTWTRGGTLDEFLVAVQGQPDVGMVYAAFAGEMKPDAYRIWYSDPEVIDPDKGDELRGHSDAPHCKFPSDDERGDWVYLMETGGSPGWKVAK